MKEDEIPDELFFEFNIDPWDFQLLPEHGFIISLSSKNAEKIKIRYGVSILRKISQNESFANFQVFPHNPHYKWNVDHFGPVIVPRKQEMLNLNIKNIGLYERLIRNYEGNLLSIKDSVIYINNIASKQYKVKMDYYFVVGDNRHMSRDSRHWGFLPEDHIIGKPWFICLSLSARHGKNRRINLDRMFDLVK